MNLFTFVFTNPWTVGAIWVLLIMAAAFVVWTWTVPVGQPLVRKAVKKAEPVAVAVDFSDKDARRKQAHKEWDWAFLNSLGDDREEFVAQWSSGGRRGALAKELRLAEERAGKEGRIWDQAELERMRFKITAHPAEKIPEAVLDLMERNLHTIEAESSRKASVMLKAAAGSWRV
jgi:hypothetical protein